MKQKTLWASALIVWMLAFTTFLSLRVEDRMTPCVTEAGSRMPPDSVQEILPPDCLFFEDSGEPILCGAYDALGWEEGTRAAALESRSYRVNEEKRRLETAAPLTVIQYAEKRPRLGEAVKVIPGRETGEDLWLAICGADAGEAPALPKGWELSQQAENLLLVSSGSAPVPFMPDRGASLLFGPALPGEDPGTVYSLRDVERFFQDLRLLAVLPGLLLVLLTVWVCSFPLLKEPGRRKKLLLANAGVGALLLGAALLVLNAVSLPTSLLPVVTITDFSHYSREFGEIFPALERLAASGGETAETVLQSIRGAALSSCVILALGPVLAAAAALGERKLAKCPLSRVRP